MLRLIQTPFCTLIDGRIPKHGVEKALQESFNYFIKKILIFLCFRGDSVYIPAGQNVLIDVSTPILNSVIIEGSLVFEDKDMTFDAYYLICMEGRVQIGTFKTPFQSKLVITMHGSKWFPRQLPEYGNKGWSFHHGVLDMHGKPTLYTWTVLTQTAEINDLTVNLKFFLSV